MISRRNIRVKVMQTLYSLETQDGPIDQGEAVKLLQKHFDQTRRLLIYLIHFVSEVARYSEKDARNKASKHLPTQKDLEVNTKIAGNELLWKIIEQKSYSQAVKHDKPELNDDQEILKRIYLDLIATDQYQQYISIAGRDKKQEKDILELIFTDLMLPNELFTSFIEEKFNNWDDDAEMVNMLLLNFFSKPAAFNFQEILSQEKWQFAKNLLETTLEKQELALDYIRPKLKNWEPDRIAVLDMILMRMGVCEFLFF